MISDLDACLFPPGAMVLGVDPARRGSSPSSSSPTGDCTMLEVSGDEDWRWNSVLVVHRMYVVSIYLPDGSLWAPTLE